MDANRWLASSARAMQILTLWRWPRRAALSSPATDTESSAGAWEELWPQPLVVPLTQEEPWSESCPDLTQKQQTAM